MLKSLLGFSLGVVYANAFEWVAHKYLLHGRGKEKGSFFSFHWHGHHRNARRYGHVDPMYVQPLLGGGVALQARGKEAVGLAVTALVHWPVMKRAPWFGVAIGGAMAAYYWVHQRSHQDTEWARKWLPWHYDHHMGPNQDANWCVTFPLFDHVMGTREPYVGTEREQQDREKRERLKASRAKGEKAGDGCVMEAGGGGEDSSALTSLGDGLNE